MDQGDTNVVLKVETVLRFRKPSSSLCTGGKNGIPNTHRPGMENSLEKSSLDHRSM